MKYLVSCIIISLLFLFSVGCNAVNHIIQIEEPTDHTQEDYGGKLDSELNTGEI